MRKYLAHLVWLIPLIAWMSCSVITYTHDNEYIAKGECLKTYTQEHWHKHSAPTYTTHTVMLYNDNAYIVNGGCDVAAISWRDEHKIIYGLGILGVLPWGLLAIFIVALICAAFVLLYDVIRGDGKKKKKKEKEKE